MYKPKWCCLMWPILGRRSCCLEQRTVCYEEHSLKAEIINWLEKNNVEQSFELSESTKSVSIMKRDAVVAKICSLLSNRQSIHPFSITDTGQEAGTPWTSHQLTLWGTQSTRREPMWIQGELHTERHQPGSNLLAVSEWVLTTPLKSLNDVVNLYMNLFMISNRFLISL